MASAKERHPQIYIERNEDPRTRQRTMPMEVLSMGYSRTGTMSELRGHAYDRQKFTVDFSNESRPRNLVLAHMALGVSKLIGVTFGCVHLETAKWLQAVASVSACCLGGL
ncbi:hypothetical protein LTR17_004623 [Elasticomyces elasticus]|nr:hypothetical protein LTR17_004623 [Elasticomyces elasticus]